MPENEQRCTECGLADSLLSRVHHDKRLPDFHPFTPPDRPKEEERIPFFAKDTGEHVGDVVIRPLSELDVVWALEVEARRLEQNGTPVETILQCAVWNKDRSALYALPRPNRHWHIQQVMLANNEATPIGSDSGFITSSGRYVDREEARRIAVAAGQVRDDETYQKYELFSEDVWDENPPPLNRFAPPSAPPLTLPNVRAFEEPPDGWCEALLRLTDLAEGRGNSFTRAHAITVVAWLNWKIGALQTALAFSRPLTEERVMEALERLDDESYIARDRKKDARLLYEELTK